MKRILALLIGVLSAVWLFAGCQNDGSNDNYDSDGFMTLTVWGGDEYVGTTGTRMKEFITKFNDSAEAKEKKVRLAELSSMSQLPTSLGTAAITGKTPDIVIWDRFSTPSNSKLLVDLTEMIERDKVDTSKFQQEALNELKTDDGIFGLPMDLDPWGIYINIDIVNEYNKDKPEAEQIDVDDLGTWSKLMAAAKKLTVYDDKGGIARSGLNTTSMDGNFFSFVYTGGGELINTDKASATFGDTTLVSAAEMQSDGNSKRVYDTLSFFRKLYDEKICATGHGGTDAFVNDQLVMTYGSMYFKQNIADVTSKVKNMKMIPFPKRDLSFTGNNFTVIDPDATANGLLNGQYGGVLGGYGLAIAQPNVQFRTAKWKERRDMAWEVIKLWTMNDSIQEKYFTTTEQITARMDLHDHEFYQAAGNISDIIPYLEHYRMRPSVKGYEQFESNVVRSQIQSMYEGNTALTTYGKIRDEGNTLLRQYQGRG